MVPKNRTGLLQDTVTSGRITGHGRQLVACIVTLFYIDETQILLRNQPHILKDNVQLHTRTATVSSHTSWVRIELLDDLLYRDWYVSGDVLLIP
jgi:hypothetical protein